MVYKEIMICTVVITSIISLNLFLQEYTKNSITTITDSLNELRDDLKLKSKQEIEDKMKSINEQWDKKFKTLAVFIEHDELEKVETNLISLESYIEVSDYNMGINELEKCIFVLEHISEKYDFSLVNVF